MFIIPLLFFTIQIQSSEAPKISSQTYFLSAMNTGNQKVASALFFELTEKSQETQSKKFTEKGWSVPTKASAAASLPQEIKSKVDNKQYDQAFAEILNTVAKETAKKPGIKGSPIVKNAIQELANAAAAA